MFSNSIYLFSLASLLGLIIGSFLNVVIIRLPKILFSELNELNFYNNFNATNISSSEKISDYENNFNSKNIYNLCFPASHCLHCQQTINWYDNIPLLSFLFLKGRCRSCQQKISLRYPFIELLSALLSFTIVYHFGFNLAALGGLVFTWFLIAITFIDIDYQLIPDNLTLPGLWLGLLLNCFNIFQDPSSAILGAAFGYIILWSVYWLFKIVTGKEGMGYGDFKLLAMLGAWLGWQALPLIILISSFLGSVFGLSFIFFKKTNRNTAIPFGPFLALGGFIALLFGSSINLLYLRLINL